MQVQPVTDHSAEQLENIVANFASFSVEAEPVSRQEFSQAIGLAPAQLNAEDLETESITETIHRIRHPLSSFFVSLFSHVGLLVGLMLFVFAAENRFHESVCWRRSMPIQFRRILLMSILKR
jgi:uncharacterized membrane protein YcjF (UPF0283 family)